MVPTPVRHLRQNWIVTVFIPCLIIVYLCINVVPLHICDSTVSFAAFSLSASVLIVATMLTAWFIALDYRERNIIVNARRLLTKISGVSDTR